MIAIPAVSFELALKYLLCSYYNHRSLHISFDYDDIFKRSMIEDRRRYKNLVIKVATLLSIQVIPSLDEVIEKYGGTRFKPDIQRMTEKYKVGL